ncbi:unnamed protein product [Oppiella nova]|uniref:Autophagy protein 5 n=1 Tax=Oppiella nova TaxID=334625 RepID=A0A7R9QSM8_9ACAR|nr:unnamed protein product [Oppiella nova]CAG2172933.1 unnamed protein product [Oppiella nova]
MSSLQRRDHNQLWLGLSNDRFDQFWAVNRSLAAADTDFRYIPFRVYARDLSVRQKLVKPRTESGAETTFGELCALALGAEKAAGLRLLVHGIRVPPETPVQWVSRHLAHCDNFVHICALET